MAFEVFIESGRAERNYWKDLWRYRELFYILSWRDLKVRYKQTVIGVVWSVLRPLLTMLIFTFVFKHRMEYSMLYLCLQVFCHGNFLLQVYLKQAIA